MSDDGAGSASYSVSPDSDRLQLFRLYLQNVCPIPKVNSFSDLVRLHGHKSLARFRKQLEEWRWSLLAGEANAVRKMKHDFMLARRDLERVSQIQRIGNIMTIIALPAAVAALMTGLPLDFGFTAIGPGLLTYSKSLEQKACWVNFGSVE